MARSNAEAPARRRINLALQGGGVNGAFAWGVLDRLLELDLFDFEGVVGTSAGAVNAVAFAHGMAQGGPAGARATLAEIWTGIAAFAQGNPLAVATAMVNANPFLREVFGAQRRLAYHLMSLFSPYQLNPFDINGVRDLLSRVIDFEAVRRQDRIKLFVNATDVETGRSRVFSEMDMSVDVVMASSCLPTISQAVEIDGRFYWDGGFSENPPIYPLLYACETPDTLLVLITPLNGTGEPRSVDHIMSRVNQITFTSTLQHELRQIRLLEHLRRVGELSDGTLERTHLHMINAESTVEDRGWQSMVEVDPPQLSALREKGRAATDTFLKAHLGDIGVRSTISL